MVRRMLHAGYERAPLPPAREEVPEETPPVSSEPPARSEKKPGKQRDPFFDNAKYLTILFVGIGHAWEPIREDSRTAEALYFVMYTFHMPAFILISGYLSRSFEAKPGQIRKLITGIAVPYLILQTIYTFFMRWAQEDPSREFHYQEPGFALWFLVALFVWRLTTPIWKSLRWPVPVALAIGLAASVTPTISADLNLMRVLQFLPFFVIGLYLKPEHFELVKRRQMRLLAAPVIVGATVFAYWAVPRLDKGWFLHDKAAADFGVPSWVGGVMYLSLFGCGLVMTACFLAWVPRRHMWFTLLGSGTLYAYLLHIFFIQGSRQFEWYEFDGVHDPASLVAITVLAGVMMTVLCTPAVQRIFRYILEPKMDWFFRKDAGEAARKREQPRGPESQEREKQPVSTG